MAFYADCEHEALPVREGNRVCLVYNLVQKRGKGRNRILKAPEYETQIAEAAAILDRFLRASDASAKIAWLLEHQYSPAGLSFSALKVADAARAGVFMRAASRARCAAHLGIVHIEESGTAEPDPGNTSTNGETRRMSTWISARFLWVMAVALNEDPLRCFLEVAAAAIDGLDRIGTRDRASEVNDWEPEDRRRPISPQFLVNLLQALRRFKKATLCDAAAEKIAARPELFKPVTLVVPDARTDLCDMGNQSRRADSSIVHLWTNSTRSLLQRSEFPPEAAG